MDNSIFFESQKCLQASPDDFLPRLWPKYVATSCTPLGFFVETMPIVANLSDLSLIIEFDCKGLRCMISIRFAPYELLFDVSNFMLIKHFDQTADLRPNSFIIE